MAFLRVDTLELFSPLRRALVDLLQDLDEGEWDSPTACTGWNAGDVVRHLIGVELGNVARRRDGTVSVPSPGEDFGGWLGNFNEEWVRTTRRLSPRILTELLDLAGEWFEQYAGSLDLEACTAHVWWAGPDPVPVWLDVAREYTERWVHQQQIREATGHPGLTDGRFVGPVIATFVHSLPHSLSKIDAGEGTEVSVSILGDGGGSWHVHRSSGVWDLRTGTSKDPACEMTATVEAAWRLYSNYPGMEVQVSGDPRVARAVLGARAIVV